MDFLGEEKGFLQVCHGLVMAFPNAWYLQKLAPLDVRRHDLSHQATSVTPHLGLFRPNLESYRHVPRHVTLQTDPYCNAIRWNSLHYD